MKKVFKKVPPVAHYFENIPHQGLLAPRGGVGSFGNSRNLRGQFSRQMDAGPDDKSPSSDAQQQVAQKKKRRR